MKPINPTIKYFQTPTEMLRWAQSIFKSLFNGVALAAGETLDSNGNFLSFTIDSGNGIMFRIGANGSGLTNTWDSSGQVVLNHLLGRQPIGWLVCDLDKQAQIWRFANSTTTQISLQIDDNSTNATVYIM